MSIVNYEARNHSTKNISHVICTPFVMKKYVYHGDKLTGKQYKDKRCAAVLRPDGKCIRGKNGNMLVSFNGTKVVVIARQLRKITGITY